MNKDQSSYFAMGDSVMNHCQENKAASQSSAVKTSINCQEPRKRDSAKTGTINVLLFLTNYTMTHLTYIVLH